MGTLYRVEELNGSEGWRGLVDLSVTGVERWRVRQDTLMDNEHH